jgi:hypothetical protein
MALASQRSLFDIGHMQLGVAKLNVVANRLQELKGKIAYLDDDQGGYLSKSLAHLGAAHLKIAVLMQGTNVPGYTQIGVSDSYGKMKERLYPGKGDHMLTGALFDAIKALNRRYVGGGRGYVVGIDQRKRVPRVQRDGTIGDSVSVAAYTADIEYGWSNDTPRPLLILAMADFVRGVAPNSGKMFLSNMAKASFKHIKESTKEIVANRDVAVAKAERGQTTSATINTSQVAEFNKQFEKAMYQAGVEPYVIAYYKSNYGSEMRKVTG